MFRIKILLIISAVILLAVNLQAQNTYFVYDGDDFSIMYLCNDDNTEVLDVQFTSKDANGEWKWSKFEAYDFEDFEDTANPGFTFHCKDGVGNVFIIDYYRDPDTVTVSAQNKDGSAGNQWHLERRKESTTQEAETTNYFVYDGDEFSVLFTCDADNKVTAVDFSSEDANGEWTWKTFENYDYVDFDNASGKGFTYFCKDGSNNRYAVAYFDNTDKVVVTFLNPDGTSGTQWHLSRRAETTSAEQTDTNQYFVYDGTEFSVMFTCNADNTEVTEIKFSGKDSNGEWIWSSFVSYDFFSYDEIDGSGFVFYCKDTVGNKYSVDYNRDTDDVLVKFINEDGSEGKEWPLYRRE